MPVTVDQMGVSCEHPAKPQRIVSLVPSQTELLFDLGLNQEIVGRTKFCIEPQDKVTAVKKIGGTKKFDFEAIHALQPDLIIGNKEENYQEGIEQLQQNYPVWMSDIATLDDALDMITRVGALVGKAEAAKQMATQISEGMAALGSPLGLSTAYIIWQKPYMVAGSGTFIDDILQRCGLSNVFASQARYPETSLDELIALAPQVLMLSSEPYPFKDKHVNALQTELPNTQVLLVEAEYFSWYGSRLLGSAQYLQTLKAKIVFK